MSDNKVTGPSNEDDAGNDEVEGHVAPTSRVQPPRPDDGDVRGHAAEAPEVPAEDDDDVEGHVYVQPEHHSPQR